MINPLELELLIVLVTLWVLGSEFKFYAVAVSAYNHSTLWFLFKIHFKCFMQNNRSKPLFGVNFAVVVAMIGLYAPG